MVKGTTFLILPTATIADAGQYGWLVHVWGVAFGLAVGWLWLYLSEKHPGMTLIEMLNKVFGKYAGGLLSVCYIVFFLQIAAWITRNVSDYMHTTMMPRTPMTMFHMIMLCVCAYAAVKGIRSITLVSLFVIPYIFIAFWLPYTIMLSEWDWRHFQIPQEFRFWPTFAETKYALGIPFLDSVVCLMIFPLVRSRLRTAFLGGTAVAGLQVALSVFFAIGILGVYRSSHLIYPVYTIFREMEFSSFMEHFESIISVNVILVVFVKLSAVYYAAVTAICQQFSIRARAPVAVSLIWVISAYAMLFPNMIENMAWVRSYSFLYYLPFGVGIPLLLLAVTWIRRAGERREAA